jgi:hypothetical protein
MFFASSPECRRRLLLSVTVAVLWISHPAADDWTFTPGEYGTLTGGGGDLTLHADSDWVPPAIRDNLLKTLKTLLDPKRDPPSTAGVSVRDLYHGHIVCPRPCPEELVAAISALAKADDVDDAAALGGESWGPVTAGNLERFVEAKRRSEARTRELVSKFFREDCAIIYHTYEYNMPDGMTVGDPRRNILTPFDGDPRGFIPPDGKDPVSYTRKYCTLAQIVFLVDETGQVHVTTGTVADLSKVVGSPLR